MKCIVTPWSSRVCELGTKGCNVQHQKGENINMNKYSHWIGRLFSKIFSKGKPCAVTIGQATYYSCP